MRPSFVPDRLGASTALTLGLRFSGGEEGVPAPLSRVVVRLPAGLGINLDGVGTCSRARLQSRGAAGCSQSSLVGRGHALAEAHTGSQTTSEESTIHVFRAPNRGSTPTFEVFGQGESPLYQSTISTALLEPAGAPFGFSLHVSVAPIPTVVYEPDASLLSMSITLGGVTSGGARQHAGRILVPRSCPAGGFAFAVSVTFADGSAASAAAKVPCP
jgi:hypothetical protein